MVTRETGMWRSSQRDWDVEKVTERVGCGEGHRETGMWRRLQRDWDVEKFTERLGCGEWKFVQPLHLPGSPVSSSIVIAETRGIVIHQERIFLKNYGGHVSVEKCHVHSHFLGDMALSSTRPPVKLKRDLVTLKRSKLPSWVSRWYSYKQQGLSPNSNQTLAKKKLQLASGEEKNGGQASAH